MTTIPLPQPLANAGARGSAASVSEHANLQAMERAWLKSWPDPLATTPCQVLVPEKHRHFEDQGTESFVKTPGQAPRPERPRLAEEEASKPFSSGEHRLSVVQANRDSSNVCVRSTRTENEDTGLDSSSVPAVIDGWHGKLGATVDDQVDLRRSTSAEVQLPIARSWMPVSSPSPQGHPTLPVLAQRQAVEAAGGNSPAEQAGPIKGPPNVASVWHAVSKPVTDPLREGLTQVSRRVKPLEQPPVASKASPGELHCRSPSEDTVRASLCAPWLTNAQAMQAAEGLVHALALAGYRRVQAVVNGQQVERQGATDEYSSNGMPAATSALELHPPTQPPTNNHGH